ncbi:hypothetical protein ACIRYZ_25300 [Kitasatospora sp. NPDC101155]|uniref:hypothetical protein n=1 Tax=Kitasatospora sp. NPDC101155 TaxID=3364097 RepID=UPI00380B9FD4
MSAMSTDSITAPAPAAPSAHRRALLTWLAVYPTITAAFVLLGPYLGHLPLPLRTLVMTALVVPVVSYALMPLLLKAETKFARRHGRRR